MGKIKILLGAMICLVIFAAPCLAQKQTPGKAASELQKNMAGESVLTETDVKTYINNLEALIRLHQDPIKLPEVVKGLGWTEKRYIYVTTKMSVGLAELMKPDEPNLKNVPNFARPTVQELTLIKSHQAEILKMLDALQKKGLIK